MNRKPAQKRARKPQRTKAGLHPAEGEALGLSANTEVMTSDAPHAPAVSALTPELDWLLAQLTANGAESPRANLDKHSIWHCRDGNRKLGALTAAQVESHDEDAVLRLFGMILAVKVTICRDRESDSEALLWAAARCTRWVKQQLLWQLMREACPAGLSPMTWANRVSVKLAEDWRAAESVRAAKRGADATVAARARRNADTLLSSSILNFAATRTLADFSRWRARESAEKGPPWATSLTFDVKGSDVELELDGDGLRATVRMLGMAAGHRQVQPTFRLKPEGGSAWATVRAIVAGEYEQRGVKIERTPSGQWLMLVAYRRQRPAVVGGTGSLVVRRSMARFLVALGSDGRVPRKKIDGAGILAYKQALQGRQRAASEHLPHQGAGARGHGRARFFRILNRLQDKSARYVETWCQQQAAFIVEQARELDYGEVVIEDFEGPSVPQARDRRFERLLRRFPFARLRQSIMHAGLTRGMRVRAVASGAIMDCPACNTGMVADEGLLWCPACHVAGEPDTIAVWRLCQAARVECDGVKRRAEKEWQRQRVIKHRDAVATEDDRPEVGA